jgi:general nucleoside transport system ATP-binding protein
MPLLSMKNIDKSFFGKAANHQVCLDVQYNEIHALLGENGAGKTTLMNILYGIYQRDAGEILYDGNSVSFTSPKAAIAERIGMVHQHFTLVPTLTVSQNITLGLKSQGHPFPNRKQLDESILAISEKYGLQVDPKALVSSLSVGEQQRVEIIKLLYRDARLLILDEPTAVLTPQETDSLFSVLHRLRNEGHSVIIITHRIPEVMSITDTVTILRDGRNIASVKTCETTEEELSHLMIGRELHHVGRCDAPPACDGVGLALDDVVLIEQGRRSLGPISFCVDSGKILGIAGVDGNGQKKLAEVIMGIRRHSHGSVSLGSDSLDRMGVLARRNLGIGYISDDRHHDSLILDMNLMENLLLKTHTEARFIKHGLIDRKSVRKDTADIVDSYQIKTSALECPIRYLSGGNQQKLILAREMAGLPRAVVAFQPTRGLDIGASEFVHRELLRLRDAGCAIIMLSADLQEILALSDHIAVIHKGEIMDIVPNKNVDLTRIGLLMAGKRSSPTGEPA